MAKRIVLKFIRWYQKAISPYVFRAPCVYTPSCSEYAIEAVTKYGAIKGSLLAAWRIMRCNPFSKGGYDPVP